MLDSIFNVFLFIIQIDILSDVINNEKNSKTCTWSESYENTTAFSIYIQNVTTLQTIYIYIYIYIYIGVCVCCIYNT